jgi:hypothetical protein
MGLIDTLGWVVLAGAVECELALVAPRLKRIVGLIERFFTASVIVWLASSPLNSYVSASAALPLRYGATPKPFHRQTAGHPSSIQSLSDAWWGTQRLSSDTSAPSRGSRNVAVAVAVAIAIAVDEVQRLNNATFRYG